MSMVHMYPCPWCRSMFYVHVHAVCPCPCCLAMSMLHVHVHAACLRLCCTSASMSMLNDVHSPHPSPSYTVMSRPLFCVHVCTFCMSVFKCVSISMSCQWSLSLSILHGCTHVQTACLCPWCMFMLLSLIFFRWEYIFLLSTFCPLVASTYLLGQVGRGELCRYAGCCLTNEK
jgi:hypothetical protein